ncbi:thermonuclease family protein [Planktothrix mougeotii]|uniref:Thermonuclease family protein n=1 Tax=Planktothrix mougeotii LEGE 06226 TaxID=1828728 RepID=A0ABR9UAU3_9CYAN|nr:thermonuclease family protein [Planktothrix mougeotii]MBE9142951.1 thermonuclease family protein [Planktothrix mougeotii LEGE 06226]
MGTRIKNLQVTRVVDGDTIKVLLNDKREFLRLDCVDTEEILNHDSKPRTNAGIAAAEMAQQYFTNEHGFLTQVDIEFDGNEPAEVCLEKYRDHHGRLICYVHKYGENFNLKLIKEGWSPYYIKYGHSRLYHQEMMEAEAEAQAYNRMIWNPQTNEHSGFRNYTILMPWWSLRASIVDDFRRYGQPNGVLSVRLDYPKILLAAMKQQWVTIFCDLQEGITKWIGNSAIIHTGTKDHNLKLWIPEATDEKYAPLVYLINKRYTGLGRGYIYVSGQVTMYRDKPEITLTSLQQLSDFCPIFQTTSSTNSPTFIYNKTQN